MLRSGRTDAAVYLQPDNGTVRSQIVVDASNTTSAQAMTMYIRGVIDASASRSPVLTYTLYNPQMKSAYNFVPGHHGHDIHPDMRHHDLRFHSQGEGERYNGSAPRVAGAACHHHTR